MEIKKKYKQVINPTKVQWVCRKCDTIYFEVDKETFLDNKKEAASMGYKAKADHICWFYKGNKKKKRN